MSSRIFISLFQYFNAWLLIAFVVALAAVSEKIYFRGLAAFRPKAAGGGRPSVNFARWFRSPVALPGGARVRTALFCPVLAFAALLTVCACLPVCTYIPIIDNGADVVQLAQFMLLSEVFVLVSLYAAGTEEALEIARAEILDSGLSDKERPRHRPVQLQFVFSLRADALDVVVRRRWNAAFYARSAEPGSAARGFVRDSAA